MVMNGLSVRPEIDKLSQLLDLDSETLSQIGRKLSARQLRELRYNLLEERHRYRRPQFATLAKLLRLLPKGLLARMSKRAGPLVTSRILVALDPLTSRHIARQLDPEFLADVTTEADPRVVRPLIQHIPPDLIRDIALVLIERGNFIVAGQLADSLPAPAIRAVVDSVENNGALIQIAYYMDNTESLGDIIRMIDNDRLTAIVGTGTTHPELWPNLLWIVDHVSHELKSRLTNIMVERDPETLNQLIQVAHEQQLWGPILRAISTLHHRNMRRVVHLDSIRDETILEGLIQAAYVEDTLANTLPLVDTMNRDLQRIVARVGLKQGADIAEAFIRATVECQLPELLLTLANRLTNEEKQELATLTVFTDISVMKSLTQAALEHGKISTLFEFVQYLSGKARKLVLDVLADNDAELFERFMNQLDLSRETDWERLAGLLDHIDERSELQSVTSMLQYQSNATRQALRRVMDSAERASGLVDKLGL